MQLRTVPAAQGLQWVRQGIRTVMRQPLGFAALISTFVFVLLLMLRLPWIGAPLMLVALPIASLGFMLATRVAIDGGFPTPRLFIEPLRGSRTRAKSLLKLGLAHAVLTFVSVALLDLADAGAFENTMRAVTDAMPAGSDTVAEKLSAPGVAPGLVSGLLLRLALGGLLGLPFWHAPALIYWGGQGVAQAMFSSTLACWRNRGAFTVYLLGWAGLALAFGMVFIAFGSPVLLAIAGLVMWLLFPTVFYASRYFTFVDCFDAAPPRQMTAAA